MDQPVARSRQGPLPLIRRPADGGKRLPAHPADLRRRSFVLSGARNGRPTSTQGKRGVARPKHLLRVRAGSGGRLLSYRQLPLVQDGGVWLGEVTARGPQRSTVASTPLLPARTRHNPPFPPSAGLTVAGRVGKVMAPGGRQARMKRDYTAHRSRPFAANASAPSCSVLAPEQTKHAVADRSPRSPSHTHDSSAISAVDGVAAPVDVHNHRTTPTSRKYQDHARGPGSPAQEKYGQRDAVPIPRRSTL